MALIELKEGSLRDRFEEYGSFVLKDGYKFDDENRIAVNRCIEIFEQNETGLQIFGNPGSGKTLIFEMLQRIIPMSSPLHFSKINTRDVVLQFNNKEVGHGVFKKWADKNICFDDLGAEKTGYLFGQKSEVMEEFIYSRYDLFRSKKIITHFTTNLGKTDLTNRYGMRCVSRLNEMCQRVGLGDNENYVDRRALRNFKELPYVKHPIVKSADEQYIQDVYQVMKQHAQLQPKTGPGLGSRMRDILGTNQKST